MVTKKKVIEIEVTQKMIRDVVTRYNKETD